jgi:hypothetical protein
MRWQTVHDAPSRASAAQRVSMRSRSAPIVPPWRAISSCAIGAWQRRHFASISARFSGHAAASAAIAARKNGSRAAFAIIVPRHRS